MNSRLEIDSVQLNFGLKQILSDVYLKCEQGEITGLLGSNGSGKTCLMNIIYGTLKPYYFSLRIDGKHQSAIFKKNNLVTYLPQFNFIPKKLTVKSLFAQLHLSFTEFTQHFSEFEYTEQLQLSTLSGGERRLVEVYGLIKSKSKFTLLDEPFLTSCPPMLRKSANYYKKKRQTKVF